MGRSSLSSNFWLTSMFFIYPLSREGHLGCSHSFAIQTACQVPLGPGLWYACSSFAPAYVSRGCWVPQRKPPISQHNTKLFAYVVAPIYHVTCNLYTILFVLGHVWQKGGLRGLAEEGGRGAERLAVGESACPRTSAELSQRGFWVCNTVFHH